ncbi:MAG: O-antigen ligase family protein [Chloroflexi bacterium]|nr:O-antigen ligase family protein [Chloroflexota bacterium]
MARQAESTAPVAPSLRRWVVFAPAFAALMLWPLWYRFPAHPSIPTPYYFMRFAFALPAGIAVLTWALGGFCGFRTLIRTRTGWAFAASLLMLAVWSYLSTSWAFRREADPQLALGASMQLAVAILFALAVASVRVPPRMITSALLFGALWHAALVGQQVALQGAAGGLWSTLGEFPIELEQARISVVQAEGIRLLRPYGLLPHPNVLAGFLATAVLASVPWLIHRRMPLMVALVIGAAVLWSFLLTFSRGAYLGFAVGALALLILVMRSPGVSRPRTAVVGAWAIVVAVAFAAVYQPFLLARAGVGVETTEQYSAAERTELNSAALTAISERPLTGVGAGNLPWRSAYILYERGSIVQGNYPHNIVLTIAGEYGLVGVVLVFAAVLAALIGAFRRPYSIHRSALTAAFVALLVAGQFDYYMVTFMQFQAGSLALIGAALADRK